MREVGSEGRERIGRGHIYFWFCSPAPRSPASAARPTERQLTLWPVGVALRRAAAKVPARTIRTDMVFGSKSDEKSAANGFIGGLIGWHPAVIHPHGGTQRGAD